MTKVLYSLFILFIILLLTGCNNIEDRDYKIYDKSIELYEFENKIDTVAKINFDSNSVLMYRKGTKIGIIQILNDEEKQYPSNINIKEDTIKNNDLSYFQFSDKTQNYIAIFILNNEIAKKTTDIYLEFQGSIKGKPNAIQQSSNGENGVIISYDKENGIRKISKVLLMRNSKIIYTESANFD